MPFRVGGTGQRSKVLVGETPTRAVRYRPGLIKEDLAGQQGVNNYSGLLSSDLYPDSCRICPFKMTVLAPQKQSVLSIFITINNH